MCEALHILTDAEKFEMRTVLAVIGAAFVFATSAASLEMSDKAQEVMDAYRVQL